MLDTVVKEVVSKIALFDIATGVLAISCQPYKPKIEVVCAHGLVTTALVSQRSTKGGPQWWCRASWRPAPPSRARARRSRARHRPHLVRVDQFAISDACLDAAYSASVTVFATLEIEKAMHIGATRRRFGPRRNNWKFVGAVFDG